MARKPRVESYEYDAHGNTTVYDNSSTEVSESVIGNRYTFQGREIDWTTGLTYFRARWYSPETGRWLSKDPIGISGGLNLYQFCGNNPVNFTDPMGLCGKKVSDGLAILSTITALIAMAIPEPASTTWGAISISAAVHSWMTGH